MAKTVVGLMESAAEAQRVVEDLTASCGCDRSDIGLMARGSEWPVDPDEFVQAWKAKLGETPKDDPDPRRLDYLLCRGVEITASAETAAQILAYAREHLAPYKRIRRIEFSDLPKTISGKIRRVELRDDEHRRHPEGTGERGEHEFWEDDLRP